MGRAWGLTGRAEELRFIDGALRRDRRDDAGARGVVLAGAAGVGKTRLAREAIGRAERRGAPSRWVTATASSRSLPLGALAELVDPQPGDQSDVAARVTEALLAEGGRSGVVIGLDDAHLLDDHSATVVHRLTRAPAATLVVTVRTGEPAPDAVTALWKDGPLERLEVQPLSETETVTLLEGVLGGPLDSAAAGRIWRMTQGNPLYLRQLVDAEIEAGRLREATGVWRWTGEVALSPALTELVASRMGTLPAELRDVLDLVALDEPLELEVLGGLAGTRAVEETEERGLVQIEPGRHGLQVRLAHPLFGEVRRADMGQVRGRRLRGRLASALAANDSIARDHLMRRALLAVDSDTEPDADLLTTAAESAARIVDLVLAQRFARAALDAGAGFRAQAIVAFAAAFMGTDDADAELVRLTELAETDADLARATFSRASYLLWVAGRPEEAESVLEEALSRVEERGARMYLEAFGTVIDGQRGRPARAHRVGTDLLAAPDLPDEAVVLASCGLASGLALLGRADEIGPVAERGMAAVGASSEQAGYWMVLVAFQCLGLRLAGRLADAARVAVECRSAVEDAPLSAEIAAYLIGESDLAEGRLAAATRRLAEARAALEDFGDAGGWRYACLIALTRARALGDDPDETRRTRADLEQHRHPMMMFLEPDLILARAWVAASEGSTSEGIALAREAAALTAEWGHVAVEVLALQTAVQLGDPTCAERLDELVELVHGPRAPAVAGYARALAEDDGDALRAASDELEAMGDLIAAADAAAQAAQAYRRGGRAGTAQVAAARAQRLADRCDGVRTPALRAATMPLPLTSREREIATLAARGLSNQQIADRLVVSVRTVEGHLYRIGQKLGTTSRAELVELLGD